VVTPQSLPKENDKKGQNFQQIYEAIYCLWSLSFNAEAREKLIDPKMIYNLCQVVKRCNKVKVIRISLATLKNLLNVGKNNERMITYLMGSLALLKQKRWGDEEMENDIKEIEETLEKNVDDLTSWDRYKNEILANKLDWSPPHKSIKFWQENYMKFEEDEYFILRTLKTILESSNDASSLSIVCWDIGEFVRVHPNGKKICQRPDLQLKIPLLKMLTIAEQDPKNEDKQKVAKEALTALQKLMITNWEYLQ